MSKRRYLAATALLCVFSTVALAADELIMYPNKGQSMDQVEKDKYECYEWAKSQSGYDPLVLGDSGQAQMPAPLPQDRDKDVGKSALKSGFGGALIGAGLGALLGGRRGALTGAAIGGVGGAIVGSEEQKSQNVREAERQRAEQQSRYEDEKQERYERAFKACLEGRDYTIK